MVIKEFLMNKNGKLFVIESGSDGSGKATQSQLLYDYLKDKGYKVIKVEFPNYKSEASSVVKMYLRGDFGKRADDVDPYVASTFYALDRYASYKTEWEDFYLSGGIVIADRYTTSNMVHQASKMNDNEEKDKFLNWLYDFEFGLYKLPTPDEIFFLDVPVDITEKLIETRKNKFTNESEKDIHERDKGYLERTYMNSKYVAEKYSWNIVDCVDDLGEMKSVEEIHHSIIEKISNHLK